MNTFQQSGKSIRRKHNLRQAASYFTIRKIRNCHDNARTRRCQQSCRRKHLVRSWKSRSTIQGDDSDVSLVCNFILSFLSQPYYCSYHRSQGKCDSKLNLPSKAYLNGCLRRIYRYLQTFPKMIFCTYSPSERKLKLYEANSSWRTIRKQSGNTYRLWRARGLISSLITVNPIIFCSIFGALLTQRMKLDLNFSRIWYLRTFWCRIRHMSLLLSFSGSPSIGDHEFI